MFIYDMQCRKMAILVWSLLTSCLSRGQSKAEATNEQRKNKCIIERKIVPFRLSHTHFMTSSSNSLFKVYYPQEMPGGINTETQLMQLNIINI